MFDTTAIIDVTSATFNQEVIERSRTTPVLVDLWATWCGPCKTLGPLLEKIATEMAGRVVLAKVDVDQNPEISEAFRVESVPTVMLMVGGKIVDGFVGAQPEAKIRAMLTKHVGASTAIDPLEEALALEREGHVDIALGALAHMAKKTPPNGLARAHHARLLLSTGQIENGRAAYDALSDAEKELDPGRAAKALIALQASKVDIAPLEARVKANPDDLTARLALGRGLLAENRNEEGLEHIYEAAKRDLRFNDSEPRKAMLEAFEALGQSAPLTTEYRRRLSVLLCS